jgi:hypothetical protein
MEFLLFATVAIAIVLMVLGVYRRVERQHRSKRLRGAVESLDAVQKTLANLAESKEKAPFN